MLTVSVSVPTYNYARFLSQCIESVLSQTFTDWELVLCDDNSTDDTNEIATWYAEKDSRIRYINNEIRLGMSANLKRAADLARGRYIKILCSDDWLAPTCLQRMVALMEAYPGAVVGSSAETYTTEEGMPIGQDHFFGEPVSNIPGEEMIDRMAAAADAGFGGNSSFIIRADAYHAVGGYDPRRLYLIDYDLAARLCRIGDYLHTDEPLFYGRVHGATSRAVNTKKLWDVIDALEIPRDFFTPRPFGSREWWRYERLSGYFTARILINSVIACARGYREYARESFRLVLTRGNLHSGIPYVPFHLIWRLYNRVTTK